MNDDQLKAAQDIVRQDPSLIWYTKEYDKLDIRSIFEAILNYGTWDQTQKLISIIGIDRSAEESFSQDFYLVGGTALALQYGHRIS